MIARPMTRRWALALLAAGGLVRPAAAEQPVLRVAKTATCGCCGAWVEHMQDAGFDVRVGNLEHDALQGLKEQMGIRPRHRSCHTAEIDGYVIEGHVPADDVRALLAERPSALGLSVPEMPVGSPGMEMGDERDPYDTLLLGHDGTAGIWRSHR